MSENLASNTKVNAQKTDIFLLLLFKVKNTNFLFNNVQIFIFIFVKYLKNYMNVFFHTTARNQVLDPDKHSFSKPWIQICMLWMQIRNLAFKRQHLLRHDKIEIVENF